MKPILSIIIPTYNRCEYLRNSLMNLVEQIEFAGIQNQVQIVISNNCSTDNTKKYIQYFIVQNKDFIKYIETEKNIGPVRNLLKAIVNSDGIFWMFMGDDDLIPKGSLIKIVKLLKENPEIPVVIFGQKNNNFITKEEKLNIYTTASRYFYYMGNACTASKTEMTLVNIKKFKEKIVTTCWPQTHLYFLNMYESRLTHPVLISTIEAYEAQPKDGNNVYNSFYLFDSGIYALLRLSQIIAFQKKDKSFMRHAIKGHSVIGNGWKVYFVYLVNTLVHYYYCDSNREKKDFKITLWEAINYLNPFHCFYIIPYLISFLPKFIFDLFFVNIKVIILNFKTPAPASFLNLRKRVKKDLINLILEKETNLSKKHASTILRTD
jgi:glycosyltransferase involved in cell wall biosynthesis